MVKLVGILNVTPDSFSDGGLYEAPELAIARAAALFEAGAALVDVGAESTRPNAVPLSDEAEWRRLEPVLRVLLPRYPGRLSLDTYHPVTVRRAYAIGPVIVNDISGMNNPEMVETVCALKAKVIISHLPGMDIQLAHRTQPVNEMADVTRDLLARAKILEAHGLSRRQIILDPGIGFGKAMQLNWQLLKFAEQVPDYEVMIGYSRKRFLGENRMELGPNIEAGRTAAAHGAAYLRVHDVAGHARYLSPPLAS